MNQDTGWYKNYDNYTRRPHGDPSANQPPTAGGPESNTHPGTQQYISRYPPGATQGPSLRYSQPMAYGYPTATPSPAAAPGAQSYVAWFPNQPPPPLGPWAGAQPSYGWGNYQPAALAGTTHQQPFLGYPYRTPYALVDSSIVQPGPSGPNRFPADHRATQLVSSASGNHQTVSQPNVPSVVQSYVSSKQPCTQSSTAVSNSSTSHTTPYVADVQSTTSGPKLSKCSAQASTAKGVSCGEVVEILEGDVRIKTEPGSNKASVSVAVILGDIATVNCKTEEDVKPSIDRRSLDDAVLCPAEVFRRFVKNAASRLGQLVNARESVFLQGLKEFKDFLEVEIPAIEATDDLVQTLTRYLYFLGMNYGGIALGGIDAYLTTMEDILCMYFDVIRDRVNQETKMRRPLQRRIKYLMAHCLLYRMDSIHHCLFKMRLHPSEDIFCRLWSDIFIYFLKHAPYEMQDADYFRGFVAWQRFKVLKPKPEERLMLDQAMNFRFKRPPQEIDFAPLRELLKKLRKDPRYAVRNMIADYWRWWEQHLSPDDPDPTLLQGTSELRTHYSPSLYPDTSGSFSPLVDAYEVHDDVSRLFSDWKRHTKDGNGLKLLGETTLHPEEATTSLLAGCNRNIFDDCISDNESIDGTDNCNDQNIIKNSIVISDEEDDDVEPCSNRKDTTQSNHSTHIKDKTRTNDCIRNSDKTKTNTTKAPSKEKEVSFVSEFVDQKAKYSEYAITSAITTTRTNQKCSDGTSERRITDINNSAISLDDDDDDIIFIAEIPSQPNKKTTDIQGDQSKIHCSTSVPEEDVHIFGASKGSPTKKIQRDNTPVVAYNTNMSISVCSKEKLFDKPISVVPEECTEVSDSSKESRNRKSPEDSDTLLTILGKVGNNKLVEEARVLFDESMKISDSSEKTQSEVTSASMPSMSIETLTGSMIDSQDNTSVIEKTPDLQDSSEKSTHTFGNPEEVQKEDTSIAKVSDEITDISVGLKGTSIGSKESHQTISDEEISVESEEHMISSSRLKERASKEAGTSFNERMDILKHIKTEASEETEEGVSNEPSDILKEIKTEVAALHSVEDTSLAEVRGLFSDSDDDDEYQPKQAYYGECATMSDSLDEEALVDPSLTTSAAPLENRDDRPKSRLASDERMEIPNGSLPASDEGMEVPNESLLAPDACPEASTNPKESQRDKSGEDGSVASDVPQQMSDSCKESKDNDARDSDMEMAVGGSWEDHSSVIPDTVLETFSVVSSKESEGHVVDAILPACDEPSDILDTPKSKETEAVRYCESSVITLSSPSGRQSDVAPVVSEAQFDHFVTSIASQDYQEEYRPTTPVCPDAKGSDIKPYSSPIPESVFIKTRESDRQLNTPDTTEVSQDTGSPPVDLARSDSPKETRDDILEEHVTIEEQKLVVASVVDPSSEGTPGLFSDSDDEEDFNYQRKEDHEVALKPHYNESDLQVGLELKVDEDLFSLASAIWDKCKYTTPSVSVVDEPGANFEACLRPNLVNFDGTDSPVEDARPLPLKPGTNTMAEVEIARSPSDGKVDELRLACTSAAVVEKDEENKSSSVGEPSVSDKPRKLEDKKPETDDARVSGTKGFDDDFNAEANSPGQSQGDESSVQNVVELDSKPNKVLKDKRKDKKINNTPSKSVDDESKLEVSINDPNVESTVEPVESRKVGRHRRKSKSNQEIKELCVEISENGDELKRSRTFDAVNTPLDSDTAVKEPDEKQTVNDAALDSKSSRKKASANQAKDAKASGSASKRRQSLGENFEVEETVMMPEKRNRTQDEREPSEVEDTVMMPEKRIKTQAEKEPSEKVVRSDEPDSGYANDAAAQAKQQDYYCMIKSLQKSDETLSSTKPLPDNNNRLVIHSVPSQRVPRNTEQPGASAVDKMEVALQEESGFLRTFADTESGKCPSDVQTVDKEFFRENDVQTVDKEVEIDFSVMNGHGSAIDEDEVEVGDKPDESTVSQITEFEEVQTVVVSESEAWWPKPTSEGVLPSKCPPFGFDNGPRVRRHRNSSASDISSLTFEPLDREDVRQHFDASGIIQRMFSLSPSVTDTSVSSTTTSTTTSDSTSNSERSNSPEKLSVVRDPRLARRYERTKSVNTGVSRPWDWSENDSTVIYKEENGPKEVDRCAVETDIREEIGGDRTGDSPVHSLADLYTKFAESVSDDTKENQSDTDKLTSNVDVMVPSETQTVTLLLTPDHMTEEPIYNIVVPQTTDTQNNNPIPSGSQPYSPPKSPLTRIDGSQGGSTPLYTPLLSDTLSMQSMGSNGMHEQDVPKTGHLVPNHQSSAQEPPKVVLRQTSPQNITTGRSYPFTYFEQKTSEISAKEFGLTIDNKIQNGPVVHQVKSRKPVQKSPGSSENYEVEALCKPRRRDPHRRTYGPHKSSIERTRKHITAEDNDELFQNGLEGPLGKPRRNDADVCLVSNMFWDNDVEESYKANGTISVNPETQLHHSSGNGGTGKNLVSILKKSGPKVEPQPETTSLTHSPNASSAKSLFIKIERDSRIRSAHAQGRSYERSTPLPPQKQLHLEEQQRLKEQRDLEAALIRSVERARLMEQRTAAKQPEGILYCIFADKWDKKDLNRQVLNKHVFPAKITTSNTRKVRFIDEPEDLSRRNHRHGPRMPEKRKRDDHPTEIPAKQAKVYFGSDLDEKKPRSSTADLLAAKRHREGVSPINRKPTKANSLPTSNGVDYADYRVNGTTAPTQTKSGRLSRHPTGKDYYDVTESRRGRRKSPFRKL